MWISRKRLNEMIQFAADDAKIRASQGTDKPLTRRGCLWDYTCGEYCEGECDELVLATPKPPDFTGYF